VVSQLAKAFTRGLGEDSHTVGIPNVKPIPPNADTSSNKTRKGSNHFFSSSMIFPRSMIITSSTPHTSHQISICISQSSAVYQPRRKEERKSGDTDHSPFVASDATQGICQPVLSVRAWQDRWVLRLRRPEAPRTRPTIVLRKRLSIGCLKRSIHAIVIPSAIRRLAEEELEGEGKREYSTHRVDGDVHHDDVHELQCRGERGERYDREPGCSGCEALEETSEHPDTGRDRVIYWKPYA
jgi:hypothetical protein